jgi:UDP-N-acetylmuramoyl-tripeptide--D-alanyl-D-alanine ligase
MAKRKTRTGLQAAIHAVTEPLRDAKRAARIAVAAVRRRLNKRTTFIGITGSHGKSTAAALLAAILGETAPTKLGILFNDSRSAARTVRSTSPRRDRYCVQEISGSPRGNLDKALKALRPQVGIVTAIGGDHRVEFRSFAEAAAEKSKLIRHLGPDGLAILNRDDPFVAEMAKDCACRIAWYGRDETATLRLISATSDWPGRLTLEVAYRGEPFVVQTRLVGAHWHISVLAALLTALELGISRETCLAAIAAYEPLFNKMSVHAAPQGAWYVLDATKLTYHGMEACLSFLKEARAPRRSVLLGTISDHPGQDRPHYERVARLALDVADRVVFTGKNAMRPRRLKSEFHDRLMMIEDREEAAAFFSRDLLPGEIVYIKGPLGDRLARLFQVER